MISNCELDAFIEAKMDGRKDVTSRDFTLDSDKEYSMYIQASIRLVEDDDCPYKMVFLDGPEEVKNGKYYIPNARIFLKSNHPFFQRRGE